MAGPDSPQHGLTESALALAAAGATVVEPTRPPLDSVVAPARPRPLTVSELVTRLKGLVESDFTHVVVTGEISSFRAWRSGHWYFDLKDAWALVPCVWFQAQRRNSGAVPEDGTAVVVWGRLSVYPPQGRVQLVVEGMRVAGQGALAEAFERLKRELAREGLFDEAHKKPLPPFPAVVGIVTSPQGAALQDMLRVLRQRMGNVDVIVAPARVQGEGAAEEIAAAVRRLDRSNRCDVIIVGRGGGSLEDLWCFNEEIVVRAVFTCAAPVVSAVGHETDFTLTDFAADVRCATPTHAAQTVVRDRQEVLQRLRTDGNRLRRGMHAVLARDRLRLQRVTRRMADPRLILAPFLQRLDVIVAHHQSASRALRVRMHRHGDHLSRLNVLAGTALRQRVRCARDRLALCAARLDDLSPLRVLGRGYAIARRAAQKGSPGAVVSRCNQVARGDALHVRLQDGTLQVAVVAIDRGE